MGIPVRAAQQDRARARRTSSTGSSAATSTSSINTPTGTAARTDGYEIRRAAVARGIPCITTLVGRDGRGARDRRGARTASRRCCRCRSSTRTGSAGRRVSAHARAARPPARAAVVVARRGRRLRRRSRAPTPTARRRDPGQFYMLAAAERWGGGADERPFLPRAFSVLRARTRRRGSSSCSRTSARARARLCELRAGDGLWLLRPARASASAPPRDGRRAAARRRRRRDRAAGDLAGRAAAPPRRRCSASATPRTPRARAAARRARRHRRRLGRPPRPRHRPAARRARRDPRAEVYACGPPPMLEAVRALCAERERAGAARARVRDGVRLRRLLRLRRADARRLRAPVRRRPGARRRRRWSVVGVTDFCGLALAHPVINALGHVRRDRRAARVRRRAARALPVRRLRLQDGHARAAPGQPAAAAVRAARRA